MEVNQYQINAGSTAVYPHQNTPRGFEYVLFGALGELGEIANKYKKILRNEGDVYKHREDLMDEAGDAVWYISLLFKELGYTFEEGCQHNLDKLAARKATGTLKKHDEVLPGVCIK